MISVFIGYGGNKGREIGEKLHEYLNQDDVSPFIAPKDVPAGSKEYITIIKKILESDVSVLIITENSLSSDRFIDEVNYISRNNIPIIPFVDENIVPFEDEDSEIPLILDFKDLQYCKFSINSPEEEFEDIEKDMKTQVAQDRENIEKAEVEEEN